MTGNLPEFIGKAFIWNEITYYLNATHIIECGNKAPEMLVREIRNTH